MARVLLSGLGRQSRWREEVEGEYGGIFSMEESGVYGVLI